MRERARERERERGTKERELERERQSVAFSVGTKLRTPEPGKTEREVVKLTRQLKDVGECSGGGVRGRIREG